MPWTAEVSKYVPHLLRSDPCSCHGWSLSLGFVKFTFPETAYSPQCDRGEPSPKTCRWKQLEVLFGCLYFHLCFSRFSKNSLPTWACGPPGLLQPCKLQVAPVCLWRLPSPGPRLLHLLIPWPLKVTLFLSSPTTTLLNPKVIIGRWPGQGGKRRMALSSLSRMLDRAQGFSSFPTKVEMTKDSFVPSLWIYKEKPCRETAGLSSLPV